MPLLPTGRDSPDLRAFHREVQSKGSIVQKLCAQDKRRRKGKISGSKGTIKKKKKKARNKSREGEKLGTEGEFKR